MLLSLIACENNANGNNENETIKNGNDTNGDSGDVGSTEKEDNDNTQGDVDSTEKEDNNDTSSGNSNSDFEYQTNSSQTGILINKYIGSSEHVVIPSHIDGLPVLSLKGVPHNQQSTAIAEGTFEGKAVKTVVIPETVTVIGYKCFKDCRELKSLTIASNSSLTDIRGRSFENCTKIEEIDLSSTQVKAIGSSAFRGCANLKSISFSNTLEKIQEKAFYECSSLLEVNFPESLTDVKGGAFAYCTSLKKIEIPTKLNLTSLDESIFHNVPALKQITFKEGREEITGYALLQTDESVEIVVPRSVKRFSPLPFLINPSAHITITFLGDAPEIVENNNPNWFGNPIVYYNPNTTGWETFVWKDKYEIKPLPQD